MFKRVESKAKGLATGRGLGLGRGRAGATRGRGAGTILFLRPAFFSYCIFFILCFTIAFFFFFVF